MATSKRVPLKMKTPRKPRRTPEQILRDKKDAYLTRRIDRFIGSLAASIAKKHPDLTLEHSLGTTQVKQLFTKQARGHTVHRKGLRIKPLLTLDIVKRDATDTRHTVLTLKGPIDYRWDDHKAVDFSFATNGRKEKVNLHFNAAAVYVAEMVKERLASSTKRVVRTAEANPAPTVIEPEDIRSLLEDMYKEIHRAFDVLAKNFENRYAKHREIFNNVDFSYNPFKHRFSATFHVAEAYSNTHHPITISGPVVLNVLNKKERIKFIIDQGLPSNGMTSEYISLNNRGQTSDASTRIFEMLAASGHLKDTSALFVPRHEQQPVDKKTANDNDRKSKLAPKFNRRKRPPSRPNNRIDAALEFGRGDYGRRDDLRNKDKIRKRGETKRALIRREDDPEIATLQTRADYPLQPHAYAVLKAPLP